MKKSLEDILTTQYTTDVRHTTGEILFQYKTLTELHTNTDFSSLDVQDQLYTSIRELKDICENISKHGLTQSMGQILHDKGIFEVLKTHIGFDKIGLENISPFEDNDQAALVLIQGLEDLQVQLQKDIDTQKEVYISVTSEYTKALQSFITNVFEEVSYQNKQMCKYDYPLYDNKVELNGPFIELSLFTSIYKVLNCKDYPGITSELYLTDTLDVDMNLKEYHKQFCKDLYMFLDHVVINFDSTIHNVSEHNLLHKLSSMESLVLAIYNTHTALYNKFYN